jgi:hypothetical protein
MPSSVPILAKSSGIAPIAPSWSLSLPAISSWDPAISRTKSRSAHWGRDVGAGRAQCEGCGGPANKQTSPAGLFRPNGFGLYDTVGNAAEWVEDCWNDTYRNAPRDAAPWTAGVICVYCAAAASPANRATSAPRPGSDTTPMFAITPTASGFYVNCSDPGLRPAGSGASRDWNKVKNPGSWEDSNQQPSDYEAVL